MRTQLSCLIFLLTGCNCMHGGCGSQMSEQTQFAGNIYSEWGSFLKEQGNGLFFRGDLTLAKGVFLSLRRKIFIKPFLLRKLLNTYVTL